MSRLDEPMWTTSSITSSLVCSLVALIFVDLDAAAQQPVVGEARGGDGRLLSDLAAVITRAPPLGRPADALQHAPGRREIGGDHLDIAALARGRGTVDTAQGDFRRIGPPNCHCSLPLVSLYRWMIERSSRMREPF